MRGYCLIVTAGLFLTSCGENDKPMQSTSRNGNSAADPSQSGAAPSGQQRPAWMITEPPANAVAVGHAKQTATEGEIVVVHGILGGRKDPISKDTAMFVLVDPEVDNPCTIGDEHCPTPWDYCCTPKEQLTEGMATVLLVGENGAPLSIDLQQYGLKPLDRITVTGTVGPRPAPQVLTIQASSLYKVPN